MTKAYDLCVKRGYHDWTVSDVSNSDPNANEIDLYCDDCESEGDAVVNVRNPNDGGDE
jgi:hypothetical protein